MALTSKNEEMNQIALIRTSNIQRVFFAITSSKCRVTVKPSEEKKEMKKRNRERDSRGYSFAYTKGAKHVGTITALHFVSRDEAIIDYAARVRVFFSLLVVLNESECSSYIPSLFLLQNNNDALLQEIFCE